MSNILTVSAFTGLLKNRMESDFPDVWIEGELSGVKIHSPSGHCYFNLKDAGAQISCTLWRSQLARIRFKPQDGTKVVARGAVSIYEPRGTYSLNVAHLEPKGRGDLQLAFEQLRSRLQSEGLFDNSRKRPLPFLSQRIGIVTSPTGAALQDMLKIIFRRNPNTEVVLFPAKVQGVGAAEEVAFGIQHLNEYANLDVIVVGRGGGSIEDLWCFNEEIVARSIAASRLPVVSAVGHEVDFTIADFAADVRAPTPSAAAELVVRDRGELSSGILQLRARLARAMHSALRHRQSSVLGLSERLRDPRRRAYEQRRQLAALVQRLNVSAHRSIERQRLHLVNIFGRLGRVRPDVRTLRERQRLVSLERRLQTTMKQHVIKHRGDISRMAAALAALSPLAVLGRGYSITSREVDGIILNSTEQVTADERIHTRLAGGIIVSLVVRTESLMD